MELNRSNMKKIAGLIVVTLALLAGFFHLGVVLDGLSYIFGILSPFIIGCVIAFILNLPLKFFERKFFKRDAENRPAWAKKMGRPLSLVLAILLVVAIVAVVLLVVVPELVVTVSTLKTTIEAFLPRAESFAESFFSNNPQILQWIHDLEFNWDAMVESLTGFLRNGAGNMLSTTFSKVAGVVSGLTNFLIGFVFACYILLQKEKLASQLDKLGRALLSEKAMEEVRYVMNISNRIFASFITGQCTEALILGAMFFIAMSLIGLPYALLVGVLVAFTALIPVFGAFIGCAVGVVLILMVNPTQALIFLVLFLVLQQIEGNLIYPRVVGGSVGLPSIWVLAAVSIGGSLMGVIGMLVFIPTASVIYSLIRRWTYKKLEEKESRGQEDVTESEADA